MDQKTMFGQAQWVCAGAYSAPTSRALDAGGVPHFPILRSHFSAGEVRKATLRVLGLGFYHCYINGQEISEDRFLPLSTDFEPRENYPINEKVHGHRIYVPEYDVTELIRTGENVLALHFGGGWYTFEDSRFGDAKAIYRLILETGEGVEEIVSSCADKIGDSFVTTYYFTQYENHDYIGFDDASLGLAFDDSAWPNAVAAKPLDTEYLFCDCPADREFEMLPVERTAVEGIYDIGRNCANLPILRLTGPKGSRVKITMTELLMPDGTLRKINGWGVQQAEFVSDGTGRIVQPMFTWFAYRYILVEGDAELIGARVIHTDADVTASFRCDNTTLNWLFDAFINTQLSNMHAGIPSDCPHLERRGYTGDGQLVCHAGMTVLDSEAFYRKWIGDISDCQDVYSGHVQYTAPYSRCGGGPGGWGCAIVEVPYQFYKHYGDTEPLKALYGQMLRYFDFLEAHSENDLVTSDVPGAWCLGDWCAPGVDALPDAFVNNYFYVKSLYRAVEIAALVGREVDIPMLEKRIARRKAALTAAYSNTLQHDFLGGFQGANAYALDIGLGDERTYQNLVRHYERLGRFDTGIFGTEIVSRVLFERGNADLAVKLLTSEDMISFEGMRRAGSTTIWEYWPQEGVYRSCNHPMFGASVAHLFDYLLGIGQAEGVVGYEKIVIRPQLTEKLNQVSGSRAVPAGKVSMSYEKKEQIVDWVITIPDHLEAVFEFGGEKRQLIPGENRFSTVLSVQ